jgi:hypothetical protein
MRPLHNSSFIQRDLCINRNNHQKPTFHPLGDFLNPALVLLEQGLLTVEKTNKKNIFSGRILEIEGLGDLKIEQAFELTDASMVAAYSALSSAVNNSGASSHFCIA